MTDHLVRWHEKYSKDGLRIIEVFGHSGDRRFGKNLTAVQAYVDDRDLPFPVLFAKPSWIEETYGVAAAPVACLIGRDGKVMWQMATRLNPDRAESNDHAEPNIRKALGLPSRKAGAE